MNANELADYIELHKYNSNYKHIQEAITMLRQQQAEIESLKKEKDQAFKDGYSMGQYATLNIR
jgi:hypothetical protein